jgi:hypothetical protein
VPVFLLSLSLESCIQLQETLLSTNDLYEPRATAATALDSIEDQLVIYVPIRGVILELSTQ